MNIIPLPYSRRIAARCGNAAQHHGREHEHRFVLIGQDGRMDIWFNFFFFMVLVFNTQHQCYLQFVIDGSQIYSRPGGSNRNLHPCPSLD